VSEGLQQTDGRRLVRAKNRERLLQAASELFSQRGYRGTTTRDVADAAGITERTLFRHVPSKAALFREAVIAPVEAFSPASVKPGRTGRKALETPRSRSGNSSRTCWR